MGSGTDGVPGRAAGASPTKGGRFGPVSDDDEGMDGNSGRLLAERLAQQNGGKPTPPIRGREEAGADVAPIFRWFAVTPPAAKPAAS